LEVINLLTSGAEMLCVEAHFRDVRSASAFARLARAPRFTLYGWSPVDPSTFFTRSESDRIRSARILFNRGAFVITPDFYLPDADWDGRPSDSRTVSLIEHYFEPVSEVSRKPDPTLVAKISEVLESVARESPPGVQTSTAMTGDTRQHVYTVSVSGRLLSAILTRLCAVLGMRDGVGSFEFMDHFDGIYSLYKKDEYRLDSFPLGCWSWNSIGRTPFAFERDSFISPIPNVSTEKLVEATALVASLDTMVPVFSAVRKYLRWKLRDGYSSAARGNYLLLSKNRDHHALLLGCDSASGIDAAEEGCVANISRVIGSLGGTIKPVVEIG
jgi:hypothetical protein